jgi:Trypsin
LRRSTRSRARAWIVEGPAWAIASLTFIGAFAIVGCGDAGPHAEETHATAEAIYGGLPDNDARQNQAVVSLKIGDATTFELCSAALIAPNVVLTARHCVSTNLTQSIACDSNGV